MKKTLLSTIAVILTTTALSGPAFSQAVDDPQVDGFADAAKQAAAFLATKGRQKGGDDDGANHDADDDHGDDGDDHDEGDDHGDDHDAGDDHGDHGADHDAGDDNGGEGESEGDDD